MLIKLPNNNSLEFNNSFFGKEEIRYNNEIVSSKRTIAGGIHIFKAVENEMEIQYEVEVNIRWHGFGFHVNVRRNGELIFTNK